MKILIATSNQSKLKEIQNYFADLSIEFISLKQFPEMPEVIEDADTLKGNAIKKAVETAEVTGFATISDDTGLEVEALGGRPGVYSARYAGENVSYEANNKKLLNNLAGVSNRKAVFKTVMALVFPHGDIQMVTGECQGEILSKFKGNEGFGYDPIFFVPKLGKTFAEMSIAEKNEISHRGQALKKMKKILGTM
ncbi:MAG: XTP/dITP diphosphatase [bacterium]|nr:XTP/dITP diphosphatase [bacterium]